MRWVTIRMSSRRLKIEEVLDRKAIRNRASLKLIKLIYNNKMSKQIKKELILKLTNLRKNKMPKQKKIFK